MSYASEVLADSPLVYVRFEETSGATCANSGSLAGNATANGTFTRNVSTGLAGLGVGIDIAGTTSDYVTYPDTAALDITGNVTYECWVRTDNPTGVNACLISKGSDDAATGGYNLQILFNGTIRVQRDNIAVLLATSTATYPADTTNWHHVAFTRAANVYTIYLDGASVASGSASDSIQATSKALHIGIQAAYSGLVNQVDGKLDEVAVYNTALSATRIAAHYAARSTGAAPTSGTFTKIKWGTGLVVTDEGSGVIRADVSPALPTVVNGQWVKGVGGVPVWAAITEADVTNLTTDLAAKQAVFTYGSSPPGSPADGDIWMFPADATNGMIWMFRYRAGSASAYKWEFVGGPPLALTFAAPNAAINSAGTQVGATGWYFFTATSGTISLPRAGDWLIGGHMVFDPNGAAGLFAVRLFTGGSAGSLVSGPVAAYQVFPVSTAGQLATAAMAQTLLAGGVSAAVSGLCAFSASVGTHKVVQGTTNVTPVRVA